MIYVFERKCYLSFFFHLFYFYARVSWNKYEGATENPSKISDASPVPTIKVALSTVDAHHMYIVGPRKEAPRGVATSSCC